VIASKFFTVLEQRCSALNPKRQALKKATVARLLHPHLRRHIRRPLHHGTFIPWRLTFVTSHWSTPDILLKLKQKLPPWGLSAAVLVLVVLAAVEAR
jgi:hypothetical protein